jgi:phosphatidylserine decarboxylase
VKSTIKYAIVIPCCVSIMLISFNVFAQTANNNASSPVVNELKTLLDNKRPDLKNSLTKLINGSAKDKKSYWYKHNSLEEFYIFLNKWLTYTPEKIANAQDYSERFKSLYRYKGQSKTYYRDDGINFVRDKDFTDWMQKFVHERGVFMDSQESAAVANKWINNGTIDMSSYQIPEGGFVSFNDFFTRKLKPGARPISDPNNNAVLVCPADCRISPISYALTSDQDFEVKNDTYNIAALLGSVERANKFAGGAALVCLLYPKDYHRFHAPVTGTIAAKGSLDDKHYYYGFKGLVKYFSEYHRAYYLINTRHYGQVGFVAIGMSDINSVNMPLPVDLNREIEKGEEIGYFAYGGSGIVILFEPGILKMSLPAGSGNGSGASKGNAPGITGATSSSIGATSVDDPAGALLESVDSSGRAATLGLQKGDVVRKINDQTVKGAASFLRLMSGVTQGSAVNIQVLRDGKETAIGREAASNGGRFVQMGTKIGTLSTK